ncbi:MAG: AgmX/PglI C-terminal domain-containing protein [Myxococcales bacterium FL481]|nr:MAG: AgmX/PglI C-terminal domain-containing protein [Myxococcales bacterium FL481]
MKVVKALFVAGLLTVVSSACTLYAREADEYQRVTRELVDAHGPAIKSCYDTALVADAAASGTVVVAFTVERKSGRVVGATAAAGTTAPPALSSCVITAMNGLQLDPPDRRDGLATFTWEFKANRPRPSASAPAASAPAAPAPAAPAPAAPAPAAPSPAAPVPAAPIPAAPAPAAPVPAATTPTG